MRCLLFPPESTSSPEKEGGSTQAPSPTSGAQSNHPSGPLPSVLSPSATSPPRMFQGPSIREVQMTVSSLREASLCVVEAVQAWRGERQKDLSRRKRRDAPDKPRSAAGSWGASGGGGGGGESSPSSESPARPGHGLPSNDGKKTARRASLEVRFPVVPTAQPVPARGEDLPTFWWFPPAAGEPRTGSGSARAPQRTSLGPETSVPEQVGRDLDEEPAAPKGHRHSDGAMGCFAPGPAAHASAAPSSDAQAPTSTSPSPARGASGVNYLARMATDTDFVGTPGSALVDFFPPDTKLYRNPFVLGHNLDDTLAVFPGDGDRGGLQDGVESSSRPTNGRLDIRRVRSASAAIVAEDARERSGERRGPEDWGDQDAPGGAAGESWEGKRFERPDSGGSRSGDGDRDGSSNGAKKRRAKGGIRFQDEEGEGGGM